MTDRVRGGPAPTSLLTVLALLVTGPVHAEDGRGTSVYRWVDAVGEVHFSDTPPPQGAHVERTVIPPGPSARTPEDDYFSVVNQLRRMQERRWTVERARREARREARLEAQAYDERRLHGWRSWYYSPYMAHPYYGYSGIGYHYWHRVLHPGPAGHHRAHFPHGSAEQHSPRHSVGPPSPRAVPYHRLR